MKVLITLIAAVMLTGCYPMLTEGHYNTVESVPGEIKSLKQSDEQMKEDIRQIKDALGMMKTGMKQQINEDTVSVEQVSPVTIQVTLQQHMLFESGSSKISAEGRKLLQHFAEGARQAPEAAQIRVVGHTDANPVGAKLRARYTDNWELSAARAAAVARALIWGESISPDRFHIEASGAIAPVADNSSEEGRAQNRRIEIFLENI